MNNQIKNGSNKGNPTFKLKQIVEMAGGSVDAMLFVTSSMNVKVKEFNQARVNVGSNYNSLKVLKSLII